jgi:hypothetical protein
MQLHTPHINLTVELGLELRICCPSEGSDASRMLPSFSDGSFLQEGSLLNYTRNKTRSTVCINQEKRQEKTALHVASAYQTRSTSVFTLHSGSIQRSRSSCKANVNLSAQLPKLRMSVMEMQLLFHLIKLLY